MEGFVRYLLRCRVLRSIVVSLTLIAILLHFSGCGTLLHPERVHQPNSGRIDPAIAVLDGVGLLLFFVPGVIAFAVDFATGAIYLPPEGYYGQMKPGEFDPSQAEKIQVPPDDLTKEKLENILSERTGRPVTLAPGSYEVSPLETADGEEITVLGQSE